MTATGVEEPALTDPEEMPRPELESSLDEVELEVELEESELEVEVLDPAVAVDATVLVDVLPGIVCALT